MAILKKIFSVIFLIFTINLFSQDIAQIYDNLIKKYEKINSYKADFTQINYWSEIGDTLISSGKIYYNKEKLLLDYTLPKKQKMLLDSTKVIIWDIAEKNAIITQNTSSVLRPIDIIKEFWNKSHVDVKKNNKIMNITLKSDEQTINAKLDNYLIKEITITQISGNYVNYLFENNKINRKINNKIFEIKLPKDVNVMR